MVKTPRPSRRDEAARQTRAAVVEAAHRLFIAQGYAATSIRQVADVAGASEQTVYRIHGDKAELLRAVVLAAVGAPSDTGNLRESPLMLELSGAPTPQQRLRITARVMREVYARGLADLEQVVVAAAAADQRVRLLADEIAAQRWQDTRSLVLAILGEATLDPGLGVDDVVDYLFAVESGAVYLTLTTGRGWTTEQYVEWFVELFERMFLSRIVEPGR